MSCEGKIFYYYPKHERRSIRKRIYESNRSSTKMSYMIERVAKRIEKKGLFRTRKIEVFS